MINVGIRKDIKKVIKELNSMKCSYVQNSDVVEVLNKILESNKKEVKKDKKEFIVVGKMKNDDDGDTLEAIREGHGLPPIGHKYVRVKK